MRPGGRPRSALAESAGVQLQLSSRSGTGYLGVTYVRNNASKPYQARGPKPELRFLGYFATAVEAAVCYAQYVAASSGGTQVEEPEGESEESDWEVEAEQVMSRD